MPNDTALKRAHWLALLVPGGLLAGAYLSQYVFGLYPCEMCWWQRWPHFAALAFAVAAFKGSPRWLWLALAAGGLLTSGLIGGFHAGVEYGWWQGITSCGTVAEIPPGSDPMDAIMDAPLVRCDAAPWDLFGISLAGWNFLFSCGAAIAIFALLAKRNRSAA